MGRKETMRMDDERVPSVRIRGEIGNTGGTRALGTRKIQINIYSKCRICLFESTFGYLISRFLFNWVDTFWRAPGYATEKHKCH